MRVDSCHNYQREFTRLRNNKAMQPAVPTTGVSSKVDSAALPPHKGAKIMIEEKCIAAINKRRKPPIKPHRYKPELTEEERRARAELQEEIDELLRLNEKFVQVRICL